MHRVKVVTDSNSGITQEMAKALGISVLPMPFYINDKLYFEEITLSQPQFYEFLAQDAEISTSQPAPGDVQELWDSLLQDGGEIVHIPMSSGLSGSCQSAKMLAENYDGRVEVVNNQRISVTQHQSVLDAIKLAENGHSAREIREILEERRFESSIYISLETLQYLKKGGRITPAAAMIGTVLNLKPVLTIQGEKLDAFAKVRGKKLARKTMIEAIEADIQNRFYSEWTDGSLRLQVAYTGERAEAEDWKQELMEAFPNREILMEPLSLSVSCHIGPGALAVAVSVAI